MKIKIYENKNYNPELDMDIGGIHTKFEAYIDVWAIGHSGEMEEVTFCGLGLTEDQAIKELIKILSDIAKIRFDCFEGMISPIEKEYVL